MTSPNKPIFYFAYGSNLCTNRLRDRVPSASPRTIARLKGHALRFHKRSTDGSGKADAFHTGRGSDEVLGVIFEMDEAEKASLDLAEGVGSGYREAKVRLLGSDGEEYDCLIYLAVSEAIDAKLTPYRWYKRFVLAGAVEHGLPQEYIDGTINPVACADDPDQERDRRNRAVECRSTSSAPASK